jgi:hypothetical protein
MQPDAEARASRIGFSAWHLLIVIRRVVDHHRQQESPPGSHQVAAIDRESPLETEIPLVTIVGVSGDDREE